MSGWCVYVALAGRATGLNFLFPSNRFFFCSRAISRSPLFSPTPRCAAVRAAAAPAPARLSSVRVNATASTGPVSLEIDPNDPTNFTLGILGDLHMDPRDTAHSYEAGIYSSIFFTGGREEGGCTRLVFSPSLAAIHKHAPRTVTFSMWDRECTTSLRPMRFLLHPVVGTRTTFPIPHTPLPLWSSKGEEKRTFCQRKKKKKKKTPLCSRSLPSAPSPPKKISPLENMKPPLT